MDVACIHDWIVELFMYDGGTDRCVLLLAICLRHTPDDTATTRTPCVSVFLGKCLFPIETHARTSGIDGGGQCDVAPASVVLLDD